MNWLTELILRDTVAHTILVYSIIIVLGVMLGKVRVFGISLGITFVLFAGIAAGHFGLTANRSVIDFVKDFGLILFVFSIGLQVGPGFFSSFKKGGLSLNLLAIAIVSLGIITTVSIHFLTGTSIPVLVGVMSGAVTNTPGLGAAQQALDQVSGNNPVPQIGLGYAVAYPFGVLGIIMTIFLVRKAFRIDVQKELDAFRQHQHPKELMPEKVSIVVRNRGVFGKNISEITRMIRYEFIISRIMRDGQIILASSDSVLNENDIILVVTQKKYVDEILSTIGQKSRTDISSVTGTITTKQILVTNKKIIGKDLADLRIRSRYNVNITRIFRSGIEIIAIPGLKLQAGDKLTVVGDEISLANVAAELGNSIKKLDEPNLVPIFIGILLGVLLGSIQVHIPGIVRPITLGLAGGPLLVAIFQSRYGYKVSLISYVTPSANLMIREIGIVLFLSSVGITAGEKFIPTLLSGEGFVWMGYGAVITLLPIVIVGFYARKRGRNFLEICGLLSGSMTDPPALAYANSLADCEAPAVAYATVYPLVMFLRIFAAQVLILLF
ncbi:MAG TPA: putative transporter [Bacteroidales bacterium]|nr:putative transporter [Bacteroidales bacterium]